MTNIVAVWQSLLKCEKEQEGQKGKKEDATSLVEEVTEVKDMNGEHGRNTLVILSKIKNNIEIFIIINIFYFISLRREVTQSL